MIAFLGGDLGETGASAIASHLASCAGCEAKAEVLDRLPSTVAAALRRASPEAVATRTFPAMTPTVGGWEPGAGPPPEVGGYAILDELGRGGMGTVYRARQARPSRLVALKMLRGAPAGLAADRFAAEAEAIAGLRHPNIVQVYEIGEHAGRPFFSMELVEGGSLDAEVREGPIPPRRAAEVVMTVARAVDHAHRHGIVHRDLKPANILLAAPADPTGEAVPKVTDFGIAKRLDDADGPTREGEILGTPAYMAPEQAVAGAGVGPAADVYGLGVILYELLTGRVPFRGPDAVQTILLARSEEPVPPRRLNPRIPRDLETACLKCLEKDPGRRYASAGALAEDLRRFLDDEPIRARPASPAGRAARWSRRHPAASASIVLGLLAGTIVLVGGAAYNARLRSALDRARAAEHAAGASAVDAARQRDLALSALRSLVYEVQETLRDEPATRAMRRRLLDRAVAGLRDLARGAADASPDLGRLAAHREMAMIFLQLGDRAEARAQFEAGARLAADLRARGQADALAELAPAERRLGRLDVEANDLAGAEAHFRRALEAAEAWCRASPASPEARLERIEVRQARANALLWARRGEAAVPELLAVCDEARAASRAFPGRREFALALDRALVKLGDQADQAARPEAARGYYEEATAVARALRAADPRDREVADLLMVVLNNRADTAFHRGEIEAASALMGEVSALAGEAAEADPEAITSQLRAVEVDGNLALIARQRRRYDEAAPRSAAALARLERLEAAGKLRDLPAYRIGLMDTLRRLDAFCRAVPRALAVDGGLAFARGGGHPPRLAGELLLARVYDRAHAGDARRAAEAAEALAALDSADSNDLFELAAAAASASGALKGDDPATARARGASADAAMRFLTRAVAKGGHDRAKIARDPRFNSLATRDDFRALLDRLGPASPAR